MVKLHQLCWLSVRDSPESIRKGETSVSPDLNFGPFQKISCKFSYYCQNWPEQETTHSSVQKRSQKHRHKSGWKLWSTSSLLFLLCLRLTEVFFLSRLSGGPRIKLFSFLLSGQSPLDIRHGQRDDHKCDPARGNPVQRDQPKEYLDHEQGRVPDGHHGSEAAGKSGKLYFICSCSFLMIIKIKL